MDDDGKLEDFNVAVGGGMVQINTKENTFNRAANHMGCVSKEDIIEVLKAVLVAQRNHDNYNIRANVCMKYLMNTLGIHDFTKLMESYVGKEKAPWRKMTESKYNDWMGWHEQGDGKLFYAQDVNNEWLKDEEDFQIKSTLRARVDKYKTHMIMSPTQSIIFRDINLAHTDGIKTIMHEHGIA